MMSVRCLRLSKAPFSIHLFLFRPTRFFFVLLRNLAGCFYPLLLPHYRKTCSQYIFCSIPFLNKHSSRRLHSLITYSPHRLIDTLPTSRCCTPPDLLR